MVHRARDLKLLILFWLNILLPPPGPCTHSPATRFPTWGCGWCRCCDCWMVPNNPICVNNNWQFQLDLRWWFLCIPIIFHCLPGPPCCCCHPLSPWVSLDQDYQVNYPERFHAKYYQGARLISLTIPQCWTLGDLFRPPPKKTRFNFRSPLNQSVYVLRRGRHYCIF